MKKAGLILLTFVLCMSTVFSFAGTAAPKEKIDSDMIARAKSLDDIKNALRRTGMFEKGNSVQRKYGMLTYGDMNMAIAEDAASSMAPAAPSAVAGGAGSTTDGTVIFNSSEAPEPDAPFEGAADETNSGADFSETNNQIQGIDEADIIKTDGEYLYIAGNRHIYIVSADERDMKVVSKIDEDSYINNIFIDEDRLVVLSGRTVSEEKPMPVSAQLTAESDTAYGMAEPKISVWTDYKSFTDVNIYDTTNKEKPELVQEFSVEGDFVTARKSGDNVYLAARKYVYNIDDLDKAGDDDIMPLYKDSKANAEDEKTTEFGEEKLLVTEPASVYICPIKESAAFTTLAVLDISGGEEAEIKSYMGSVNELYMNKTSAYLTFDRYEYNEKTQTGREYTDIIALDIDSRNITYRADGTVEGSLLNQFSMDEYDGYFRIATTEWHYGRGENSSNLFVLDENLDTVGSIRDIARGEQIYSVRFMGDKGYIVTFETMDPFFTVDLSDPKAPKIAGELKLPGYSNYLHQIDENTVLGIGRQTKELFTRDEFGNEESVGYRQGGIKLSLFDISDFSNPKELDSYILGDDSMWSDALYDHKAIMMNTSQNLVGICASSYSGNNQERGAYLFDVSGGSIELSGSVEMAAENNYANGEYEEPAFYFSRICYIGDTYYYLDNGTVYALELNGGGFKTIGQLGL